MVGTILALGLSLAQTAQSPASPPPTTPQSACSQALADAVSDAAATEICSGADAARLADAAPQGSPQRVRQLEAAAGHYRRAAFLASKAPTKLLALNLLVSAYDAAHLNDARQTESALREIIALSPEDMAPVFRLAKVQEDQGFIELAETTLLDVRHRQPDEVEPNKMLAQFYARRVTALHKQSQQKEPQAVTNPGERDEHGVYRVGGSVPAPPRLDVPRYPAEAQAVGVAGTVVAEVVIDPFGNVTDVKIVRSIPWLDEAAMEAVRNWRYAPTIVNGEPVPVRTNVTVNFSLPAQAPRSR